MNAVSQPRSNGQAVAVPKIIVSSSPATGRVLGQVRAATSADITAVMTTARQAQSAWNRVGLGHRLRLLHNLKDALYRNFDRIVDTIVAEQGKPPFEAITEFWPSIELVAYYVRTARRTLTPRRVFIPLSIHHIHWVERHPHGVVLVIAPWNFPLLLSLAPIAAALATGNTVVYKPSEYATQLGETLANVIYEAGIPREVFQMVHGEGDVGAALIREKPNKICFTGSVATGRKVATAAGELLIPVTLELGGKDAAIVLEDADLDRTARGVVWGGMVNAGQACLSIERVYVMRSVAAQLVERMAQVMRANIHPGPGEAQNTTMGAITTAAQIRIIDNQVREAVEQGAQVVVGGQMVEEKGGRCYLPTILTNVTPEMRIVKDETFGPVLAVMSVDSDAEAVAHANASPYGLTGSVWTRNKVRGLAIARQLQVGHASVNDHVVTASYPQLPWGGVKDSGYGRTRGDEGLLEMTTTQGISVERFEPLPSELTWYPYTPSKNKLLRRIIQFLYASTWQDRLRALLP